MLLHPSSAAHGLGDAFRENGFAPVTKETDQYLDLDLDSFFNQVSEGQKGKIKKCKTAGFTVQADGVEKLQEG